MSQNRPSHPFHAQAPSPSECWERRLLQVLGDYRNDGTKEERKAALQRAKRHLQEELSRIDAQLKELS